MKKALKWIGIIVAALAVLLIIGFQVMKSQTKKHSPEDTVELVQGDTEISVFYNRPSKKGREIFGGLVPYNEVWRTGANEATTFSTNKDLMIDNQTLPAGEYTLWTIPDEDTWAVIFNDKMYSWGVSIAKRGAASRDPESDVLKTMVPVEKMAEAVEMFTIELEKNPMALTMSWDQTKVAVPIQIK
jgi:hypothetical protein